MNTAREKQHRIQEPLLGPLRTNKKIANTCSLVFFYIYVYSYLILLIGFGYLLLSVHVSWQREAFL